MGSFEILHCDVFVPVHMQTFDEKFTIVVFFPRPGFDHGNRNPLTLIVFHEKRGESRLARCGRASGLDNVIEIDSAGQLFDCLFPWRFKWIVCSNRYSAPSRRDGAQNKAAVFIHDYQICRPT